MSNDNKTYETYMKDGHERVVLSDSIIDELELIANEEDRISIETVGISNIAPGVQSSTHQRLSMLYNASSSAMPLCNPEVAITQTGMNTMIAGLKSSRIVMPVNGKVIKKIKRNANNYTLIYLDISANELSSIDVSNYVLTYEKYGYELYFTEDFLNVRIGEVIYKDTILAESPSYDTGIYTNTVNLVGLQMIDNRSSEDSLTISDEAASKLESYTYPKFTLSIEKDDLLCNTYGSLNEYRPIPNVGDIIRDDMIILAKRTINNILIAPSLLDSESLMEIDENFDKCIMGPSGGEVIDVRIIEPRGVKNNYPKTMKEIYEILEQNRTYNKTVLSCYDHRNENIDIGNSYIKVAMKVHKEGLRKMTFKYEKINVLRIVITIRKIESVSIKSKLSGEYGNKAIVCKVVPKKDMYRLDDGTYADFMFEAASPFSRNNNPVMIMGDLGMMSRQVRGVCRNWFGVDIHTEITSYDLVFKNRDATMKSFDYIMGFLETYGSPTTAKYQNMSYDEIVAVVYETVCDEFRFDVTPLHVSPIIGLERLDNSPYALVPHKMTSNLDNQFIEYENPVTFTVQAFMFLNKLGDDVKATHIPFINSYQLSTNLAPNMKDSRQNNYGPPVLFGGTETRLVPNYVEAEGFAHVMDLSKSHASKNFAYGEILRASVPSNIDNLVDRSLIPYGEDPFSKQYRNVFRAGGFDHTYESDGSYENDKLKAEVLDKKWTFTTNIIGE